MSAPDESGIGYETPLIRSGLPAVKFEPRQPFPWKAFVEVFIIISVFSSLFVMAELAAPRMRNSAAAQSEWFAERRAYLKNHKTPSPSMMQLHP